jgi:hypothetical protein
MGILTTLFKTIALLFDTYLKLENIL